MKLYSYFRSSASYRVRIALHHKQIKFEYVPVHLVKDGGQQHKAAYRSINPMGHVPALEHEGFLVAESMAIMQYLDQAFPGSPLWPRDPKKSAVVTQICEIINSGIQPLQNLKVNQCLEQQFALNKTDVEKWNQHWIRSGLSNLEKVLQKTVGTFCVGGEFSAADCFLVPQCFSARRFKVNTEEFPLITQVERNALALDAVKKAAPDQQPDYAP